MPQGTIKTFDQQTFSGSLVMDDQTELTFDTDTFAASHLMQLRPGQRVRFDVEGEEDGRQVRNLQIVAL